MKMLREYRPTDETLALLRLVKRHVEGYIERREFDHGLATLGPYLDTIDYVWVGDMFSMDHFEDTVDIILSRDENYDRVKTLLCDKLLYFYSSELLDMVEVCGHYSSIPCPQEN